MKQIKSAINLLLEIIAILGIAFAVISLAAVIGFIVGIYPKAAYLFVFVFCVVVHQMLSDSRLFKTLHGKRDAGDSQSR